MIHSQFDKLSGGLGGGLDPPAFQRAERERLKKTLPEESVDEACAVSIPSLGLVCGSLHFLSSVSMLIFPVFILTLFSRRFRIFTRACLIHRRIFFFC